MRINYWIIYPVHLSSKFILMAKDNYCHEDKLLEVKFLWEKHQNFSQCFQLLGPSGWRQLLRSLRVGRCEVMNQELQFSFAIRAFPVGIQKGSASTYCPLLLIHDSFKILYSALTLLCYPPTIPLSWVLWAIRLICYLL